MVSSSPGYVGGADGKLADATTINFCLQAIDDLLAEIRLLVSAKR